MSEQTKKCRKILFVDDEPEYLELLEQVFSVWSKETLKLIPAYNTAKALTILQDQAIDLLVCDFHMPGVDGLQFLRLIHRKYPHIPKAILTGDYDEEKRQACLAAGAEMFIQKPTTIDAMENVFATLNELARWQPNDGFRGVMRRVGLQEIIQMECLNGNSSILEITTGGISGEIYIQDGNIIHAHVVELVGVEAFNYLLSLSGGEFNLRNFSTPENRTIEGSWEFLLMEAARLRDESQEKSSVQVGGSFPDAPSEPSSKADPATSGMEAEKKEVASKIEPIESGIFPEWDGDSSVTRPVELEEQEVPFEDPLLPAAAVLSASPERALKRWKKREEGARMIIQSDDLAPKVQEMLVCSWQGDVLYSWQCQDTENYYEFLDGLAAEARMVEEHFPFGTFEGWELDASKFRMVSRLKEKGMVLIKTSKGPELGKGEI